MGSWRWFQPWLFLIAWREWGVGFIIVIVIIVIIVVGVVETGGVHWVVGVVGVEGKEYVSDRLDVEILDLDILWILESEGGYIRQLDSEYLLL